MKNTRNRPRSAQGVNKTAHQHHTMSLQDFDELAAAQSLQVEHQTIPGFLRRIPHKWHLNEIARFGGEVGRAAESLQLVYMTAVDRSLGVLRVFPLPLLDRVYTLMQPQFGWPSLQPALDDGTRTQRDELRKHEVAQKHLQAAAEHAPNPAVASALEIVLEWLEEETKRLNAIAEHSTPPPPLRAL